ncbi:Catechol 2,3-dioxygenase or other lactoylglutathione lyase family enzyme [Chelatococcus sambhunathii]|uniref:Catechol 2,3-dioxygenase or other lactoylglutathione lyase family enzyme n=1 Tax=Chelatococcus sambhunathii TaxID=363953 RepID=A0ABM9U2Y5_9HYPH|nr:ring-cleaving dioxygenase [Chelatococcus sambhunathii]CUA85357.1 Catechol 2,3-dioxygenase or other lactoylglutathione lyase family enzyme [Chelatococcus sambhunathii]
MARSAGIHHVTAIASDPRRNLDFYTRVLGLRFVKKTVNFDDPSTYHFYFGDEEGNPGTILTFFPWSHVAPGRPGVGQTLETAFLIPEEALGFWTERLVTLGVTHEAPIRRFDRTVLPFRDPDGMRLALVATPGLVASRAWTTADIPAEAAVRGFAGVTLLVDRPEPTAAVLTEVFGFVEAGRTENLFRYRGEAEVGGYVDLRIAGGFLPGTMGAGSVHHVAFRAAGDADQAAMAKALREKLGIVTTEQKERNYFRSVYFREPGGVIFEIATDDPGFGIDESFEALGTSLKLPPFYEKDRERIEAVLPVLD